MLYDRAVAEGRRRTEDGAREAFALLSRVIAFDSNYAPAWATMALVSTNGWIRRWPLGGGRDSLLSQATRASRRAVQLDSGLADAWVVYGRAASILDVTDRGASRRAYARALAIDPRNVDALFDLGLMEEDLLRPRAAEQAWRRALAVSPTHLQTLSFLGLHYTWWTSDFARARRLIDSALAIDPTYAAAREAAGEIALAQRRWADAERHGTILRTTSGAQERAVALSILARALAGRGAMADARRYLQDAEREGRLEDPSRHAAIFVAAAAAQLGDTARAVEWLRAYTPREDLHFQLHLKREPGLRWVASAFPALLTPAPPTAERE